MEDPSPDSSANPKKSLASEEGKQEGNSVSASKPHDSADLKRSMASEGEREEGSITPCAANPHDTGNPQEHRVMLAYSYNPWSLLLAFRSAKILTVEPVLFLYVFAVLLYIPMYEQYFLNAYAARVLENTSYPYPVSDTRCISGDDVTNYTLNNSTYNNEVQSKSSLLVIYSSVANRIPSIVMTLILGPLSDRYGRRFVMVTVALGGLLQGAFAMLIVHFKLNIMFFILSAGVSGLGGDFSAILTGSFSYLTDISQGKWRTVRIGMAESMIMVGGLLAQGLGGLWFQRLHCNLIPPLFLFVSCHAAIILYTLIFLPPSLTVEERKRRMVGKRQGFRELTRGFGLFFCAVREYSVWKLWFAIIPMIIFFINDSGSTYITVFFLRYLDWSPSTIGAFQAVSLGSNAVVLLVGLPILVLLKLPDPLITLVGIFFNCACNILIGLFTSTPILFSIVVVQGLAALIHPPLRSYMSKVVSGDDQGALFSIVTSCESLAVLASNGYTYLLPLTIGNHLAPGTAFVLMGILGFVSIPFISVLVIHWCTTCGRGRGQKLTEALDDDDAVTEKTPLIQDQSTPPDSPSASQKFSDSAPACNGSTLPLPPPYTAEN